MRPPFAPSVLAELNAKFALWLQSVYHTRIRSRVFTAKPIIPPAWPPPAICRPVTNSRALNTVISPANSVVACFTPGTFSTARKFRIPFLTRKCSADFQSAVSQNSVLRAPQSQRELILKVWHADPLCCPACGQPMRVIAVIDQPAVVEKILRCLGLWSSPPRAAPARTSCADWRYEPDPTSDPPRRRHK